MHNAPNNRNNGYWEVGAILFLCSSLGYVVTGILCTLSPPSPRMHVANKEIPFDSTCLKVTRHADYITAELGVGTPTTQISLLLRLDKILSPNSSEPAMRIFAQDTVESTTVSCDVDGKCRDVVVMQTSGPEGQSVRSIATFNYRHASVESAHHTTASKLTGVGGELALRQGTTYWITSTHMCYKRTLSIDRSEGMVAAFVKGSTLLANKTSLLASTETRSTPVADSPYARSCTGDNYTNHVRLFPVEAGSETTWLSILHNALYNNEPESVDMRRIIAELGTTCAATSQQLYKHFVLYHLDCDPYGTCIKSPSMPMRRVATSYMVISTDTNSNVGIWTDYTSTLSVLPRLADSTEAFAVSIVRLVMIVLAASVVYVRAKRDTASSAWLFRHCTGDEPEDANMSNAVEDLIIGALAFLARGAIAVDRTPSLSLDNQMRVCISELVATSLSAVHWAIRNLSYFVCTTGDNNKPISKLGGSTAIIDSTSAVMMAFTQAPTLVVSTGRFDPTARLLTGILISLIVTERCSFSACCCGILYKSVNDDGVCTKITVAFSALMWVAQSCCLSIIIVDLLVTPTSYSMSRNLVGSLIPGRVLFLLGLVCAGLPRLMRTVHHILRPSKSTNAKTLSRITGHVLDVSS